jgi:Fe(3+) dicitrate transport protein
MQSSLPSLIIQGWTPVSAAVEPLQLVHQTYLTAGKTTHVVVLDKTMASLPEKSVRQVWARIPGAFAYDMDGTGNQINLALRGLDPHRSWDMNVRQNGIVLNSDMYGYPASHYNPPLESVERIELLRGTAALQYGAMLGGMLNYVTRLPDTTRPIAYEGQHGVGYFGMLSSYNSLGGRKGRFTWQAYDYRRRHDGFRQNSRSAAAAQYATLIWQSAGGLRIRGELARSTYTYQIPGPLSDSLFRQDPRQSTRSRNHYSPDILIPSVTVEAPLGPRTVMVWTAQHLTGFRNSVQFIGSADRPDTISAVTGQYASRQVDRDGFHSTTSEVRLRHQYILGKGVSTLVFGARWISNNLHRRQLGKGTTGVDFDLTLVDPVWGRDVRFKTSNAAFFAEHLFQLTPKLLISPGIRVETGLTNMTGAIRNLSDPAVDDNLRHRFFLAGCSAEYKVSPGVALLGGIAQGYRPVIMSERMPANDLEVVDPDMRDSKGYNAELGVRGHWLDGGLHLQATLFLLQYDDRIGQQAFQDSDGTTRFLRTNVGDTRTAGVELYAEGVLLQTREGMLSLFTSTAWMDGRYTRGSIWLGGESVNLKGKFLESAPRWTTRNGLNGQWRRWNAALQFSFVDRTWSDARNTVIPVPNGTRGLVPAYAVWDAHLGATISHQVRLRLSCSNLGNASYFTKRPTLYPGPGVWPSDGRSLTATVMVRM